MSPALRQRVDASLDAYNTWMIWKIVLSGYDKDDSYLEAMSMWEYVLSKSVKEEDIFLDRDWYDTLASMQWVFDFIDDPKIIIFTQRYHLRRSIFLARQSGLDAVWYSSQDTFSMTDFWTFREIFARVKAFIEVYFWVLM